VFSFAATTTTTAPSANSSISPTALIFPFKKGRWTPHAHLFVTQASRRQAEGGVGVGGSNGCLNGSGTSGGRPAVRPLCRLIC
jgi:hypothetical protein